MSYSDKWYTPEKWWEWIYATLGTRDVFDPAPAGWDGEKDGLSYKWPEKPMYCNHPGGRGNKQKWWDKIHEMLWYSNNRFIIDFVLGATVKSPIPIVWALFNIEHAFMIENGPLEQEGWLVVPRSRVKWVPAKGGKSSPVCRAGFWTNVRPAKTPEKCFVFKTPCDILLPEGEE